MLNRPLWPVVLAAMVAVTATCTVLYLLAPFESPERLEADVGLPGMVEPQDRITALTEDGELVILHSTTGELSEVVARMPDLGESPVGLAIDEAHKAAYLARPGADGSDRIVLVRLKTGKVEHVTDGTWPAVGLLHHPQLPRTKRGPEVERLAHLLPRDGGTAEVVIENLTTGARRRFPAAKGRGQEMSEIHTVAWDAFANRLYLTASGSDGLVRLWRLDSDRARDLAAAELVGPDPAGGSEWVGVANLVDHLAVIERPASGAPRLIAVDRVRLEPAGPLLDDPIGDVAWVDAGPDQHRLLIVTTDGSLYRWDATTGEGPVHLADGIVAAAW